MRKQDLIALLSAKPVANPTRPFERARYDEALRAYLELIRPRGTIQSIYRFGTIGVPGLSDIDLVAIMKTDTRDFYHRYSIQHLTPNHCYLFSHDPIFVDATNFKNMALWFPVREVELVYGQAITMNKAPEQRPALPVIHLAQMLLCFQLQLLTKFAYLGTTLDERVAENVVKGMCNSLSLWIDLNDGVVAEKYRMFHDGYLTFRPKWFDFSVTERASRLREFIADATILAIDLVGDLDEWLLSHWFTPECSLHDCETAYGGDRIVFTNQWSSVRALEFAMNRQGFLFPPGLGMFLLSYRQSQGPIGTHINQLFGAQANLPLKTHSPELEQVFKQHIAALDSYAAFLPRKFGIPPNPFVTFWAPYTQNRLLKFYNKAYNKAQRILGL